MSRYAFHGTSKDQNGRVVELATVSVYLAGTTTPASIYTASTGGTAVNSVTSAANGQFHFYVYSGDYLFNQTFKVVITKANYETVTLDNVSLFPAWVPGMDFYLEPSGAGDSALIQDAINDNLGVVLSAGYYIIDADITVPDYARIRFAPGAWFLASANNRTFFKSTTHAYFSQIYNANLDGNGKSGVTGFDMAGFRHSAGIYSPIMSNMENGIILNTYCWDTVIDSPFALDVNHPIIVKDGSSSAQIIHPAFDSHGTGATGIEVVQGPSYGVQGARIWGGYIQGFANGIIATGYSTQIEETFFENNSNADISFDTAYLSNATRTQHWGNVGTVAIKGRNCDSITVTDPAVGSSCRSTGVFDFNATNVNCKAVVNVTAAYANLPIGIITGISWSGSGAIPTETSGTFTPVAVGSAGAGTGTYTTQDASWRKIGNQVHIQIVIAWSAHTGTGYLEFSGIPTGLRPVSYIPYRTGDFKIWNAAFTGPQFFVAFAEVWAGTLLEPYEVSAAGVIAILPIPTAANVIINMVYDL